MKLELFKDGTAIFSERKPMHNLKIEVDCEGGIYVGDKRFPIVNGVAAIGMLPSGEYKLKITSAKQYHVFESIVVYDTGMATVNTAPLCNIVAPLKSTVEKLVEDVKRLEKQLKEHEERISGVSLFGN